MKKKVCLIFTLVILFAICIPIQSFGDEDRSCYMSSFSVKAELDTAGNMQVEERITYHFTGSYNDIYRSLTPIGNSEFNKSSPYRTIEKIAVFAEKDGSLTPFSNDPTEAENTYQISMLPENGNIRIKAFSKSKDEEKTFIIHYTVNNAAVKYNDTAELYWKFIGSETDVEIHHFNVDLKIPSGASADAVKVFTHGPLSGKLTKLDAQNMHLNVEKLLPHNQVEVRVLFPTALIPGSTNTFVENRLAAVLEKERKLAREAVIKRQTSVLLVGASFILALFELSMILYMYFKFDRRRKINPYEKVIKEPPAPYAPAVLSLLWHYDIIRSTAITATMMDLVSRGHLRLEQQDILPVTKNRPKKSYAFIRNEKPNTDPLSRQEQFLVYWMLNIIGKGDQVTIQDINTYIKSKDSAKRFKADYETWTQIVKEEAEPYGFYIKPTKSPKIIGIVTPIVGFAYGIFTGVAHGNAPGCFTLIVLSILLFIYSGITKRRSVYGLEQLAKWKAFDRYLRRFTTIDKADLPEVQKWEQYLAYTIALGSAKSVINQFRLVYRDMDFSNPALTYMYYIYYNKGGGMTSTIDPTYTHTVTYTTGWEGFSGGGGDSGVS